MIVLLSHTNNLIINFQEFSQVVSFQRNLIHISTVKYFQ